MPAPGHVKFTTTLNSTDVILTEEIHAIKLLSLIDFLKLKKKQ